jgi:aspartate carbamoyltransferase catalytic subunit
VVVTTAIPRLAPVPAPTDPARWAPPAANPWRGRHLLSMADLDRDAVELLLHATRRTARDLAAGDLGAPLAGRVLMSAFFDASTRTRLAHETAMLRLGGQVSGFADASTTRAGSSSQESVEDVLRMLDIYGDVIVSRRTRTGGFTDVAPTLRSAVLVNGGDGAGEHPTQTLTDLATLHQECGGLDGLRVVVVNDLRMRCVRSLVRGLRLFDASVVAVAAPGKELEPDLLRECAERGQDVARVDSLSDALWSADAVYCSPTVATDREDPAGSGPGPVLSRASLRAAGAPPHLKVLHPLPRGPELQPDLDDTPHDAYFAQAGHGVTVRMALLRLLLGA